MTRAVRIDAHRFHTAYHETTGRLERIKAIQDLCYEAIRKALFPRATHRDKQHDKGRGE